MCAKEVTTKPLHIELLADTVQKLSMAADINSVTTVVRTVARKLCGADGATFVLRENDMCYYADEDAISPLWKGSRFPMSSCASGWVMENRTPLVVENIYQDDRIPKDAYRPTFVKSLAMVPIRTRDPLGAIGNYWADNHNPSPSEVATLQALADVTAVAIENIYVRDQLKEKLAERARMISELEKQNARLEEFSHIVSHNLRAPISNLLALSDSIDKSPDEDEKSLFVEKQKLVIQQLNATLDEVVEAVQVKNDFSVERDYIELENALRSNMMTLQQEIERSDARVMHDFSEARSVYYPQSYLDSIFQKLLSNALRYRAPDRSPEVYVRSFKKDGWTFLEFTDNGVGIDLSLHGENLFKLHKTFHAHPDARGFGLFIVKTQIEAIGGSIDVASEVGKGTTFTLKLHENK